jgi:two-component system, LuxR family, sensor kinase FixL
MVVSLVLFVRAYFGAGRAWLALAIIAMRGVALAVNFLGPNPNLNFVEIVRLRRMSFLGEDVSVAEGIVSGWTRLGELSSVLLLAYLLDAAVTVRRRGERRASFVAASLVLFILFAAGHTTLIHAGVLSLPYLISLSYAGIIAVMGYELSVDVLRASELARDLRRSEDALRDSDGRLALAADAAKLGFWSWDRSIGRGRWPEALGATSASRSRAPSFWRQSALRWASSSGNEVPAPEKRGLVKTQR